MNCCHITYQWDQKQLSFFKHNLSNLTSILKTAINEKLQQRLFAGYAGYRLYDSKCRFEGKFLKNVICINPSQRKANNLRVLKNLDKTLQIYQLLQKQLEQFLEEYEQVIDAKFKEQKSPTKRKISQLEDCLHFYYLIIKEYSEVIKDHLKVPNDRVQELMAIKDADEPLFYEPQLLKKLKRYVFLIHFTTQINCTIPFSLIKKAAEWTSSTRPSETDLEAVELREWCERIQKRSDLGIFMKGLKSIAFILNERHSSKSSQYEFAKLLLSLSHAGFSLDRINQLHLDWRSSLQADIPYRDLMYKRGEDWVIPILEDPIGVKIFDEDRHMVYPIKGNDKEVIVIGPNRTSFFALEEAQKQEAWLLNTPEIIYTDPKGRFVVKERLYALDLSIYKLALKALFLNFAKHKRSPTEIEKHHLLFDLKTNPPQLKTVKGFVDGKFNLLALEDLARSFFENPNDYKEVMDCLQEDSLIKSKYQSYQQFFLKVIHEASQEKSPLQYEKAKFENFEDAEIVKAGKQVYLEVRNLLSFAKKFIETHYLKKKGMDLGNFFITFEKRMVTFYEESGGCGQMILTDSKENLIKQIVEDCQIFIAKH